MSGPIGASAEVNQRNRRAPVIESAASVTVNATGYLVNWLTDGQRGAWTKIGRLLAPGSAFTRSALSTTEMSLAPTPGVHMSISIGCTVCSGWAHRLVRSGTDSSDTQ